MASQSCKPWAVWMRPRAFAAARDDDGTVAGPRQPAHQMAADETGGPDDDDPCFGDRQFACAATVVAVPRGGIVPRRAVND